MQLRCINKLTAPSNSDQNSIHNPVLDALGLGAHDPNLTSPVLELISPPTAYHPSGAGKTSLLYLIISYAILPAYLSSTIPLHGQDAAVIFFDPLNHFSISRLVQVTFNLLRSKIQAAGQKLDEAMISKIRTLIETSLVHVHIYRPKSWSSLLTTIRSLPDYLFSPEKHHSMHRRIHSIILDDIDAFVWHIRNSASSVANTTNPLSTASLHLTIALQKLSARLSCALILTSSSASSTVFRSPIPMSWNQNMQVTRLAVRRAETVKFAPAISLDQAEVERQQRWKVVSRGKFECGMSVLVREVVRDLGLELKNGESRWKRNGLASKCIRCEDR